VLDPILEGGLVVLAELLVDWLLSGSVNEHIATALIVLNVSLHGISFRGLVRFVSEVALKGKRIKHINHTDRLIIFGFSADNLHNRLWFNIGFGFHL
jgi:hypothetical protein